MSQSPKYDNTEARKKQLQNNEKHNGHEPCLIMQKLNINWKMRERSEREGERGGERE